MFGGLLLIQIFSPRTKKSLCFRKEAFLLKDRVIAIVNKSLKEKISALQ